MVAKGANFFFPVFANLKEDHEVRINALAMIFYSKPSATDLAKVFKVNIFKNSTFTKNLQISCTFRFIATKISFSLFS